jgi:hypothetical protein
MVLGKSTTQPINTDFLLPPTTGNLVEPNGLSILLTVHLHVGEGQWVRCALAVPTACVLRRYV